MDRTNRLEQEVEATDLLFFLTGVGIKTVNEMRQRLRFLLTIPGIGSGSGSGRAVLGPGNVGFAETKSYFIVW